ncbi:hypothetical protein C5O00_08035 [Pukyongia salina]|uniref:Uncharacterized protein n=1 Tax=Pukyongia salina TaxID=2094025 RepID=A0A2S0HWX3_9FLAO|nr:hypothetical protein [Pukyongia salina]AVI51125.1 hypothetical protein C5O00_08035 [Pukyongia salina]
MKDSVKHFGALILTAIYCFAVSIAANVPLNTEFQNNLNSGQEHNFAPTSHNLLSHTVQSEFSVEIVGIDPAPDTYDNTHNDTSLYNSKESVLSAEFTQYNNYSVNFLIQQRKADLLFPYHFFW